jgi:hypothetical protein
MSPCRILYAVNVFYQFHSSKPLEFPRCAAADKVAQTAHGASACVRFALEDDRAVLDLGAHYFIVYFAIDVLELVDRECLISNTRPH